LDVIHYVVTVQVNLTNSSFFTVYMLGISMIVTQIF